MPRVSFSNDYLLERLSCHAFSDCYQAPSNIFKVNAHETSVTLSPKQIDEILSRKLYNQLKTTPINKQLVESNATGLSIKRPYKLSSDSLPSITYDADIIALIDRFFDLTYANTIPMVNLLATAVATNCLKENIRALDKKLQEQQNVNADLDVKRGYSLLYAARECDNDDDTISWASAPT